MRVGRGTKYIASEMFDACSSKILRSSLSILVIEPYCLAACYILHFYDEDIPLGDAAL